MARYSEGQIQQVKNAVDIVDVISKEVTLKPSGRILKGLCPFHTEKTPSFMVYPDEQRYMCYGCGKHGDVLSFYMDFHHLSFYDAVKKLASEAGITLHQVRENEEEIARREQLAAVNKAAMDFFHYQLLDSKGKTALDYLLNRHISMKTINTFHLGYAPDSWEDLVRSIPSTGYPAEMFYELGIISKAKNGNYIDRYRHRLVFPILNHHGLPVGFGARKLREEDHPKYVNSPETPIYKKKEILYGLFYAADAIRREGFAIFVEGYMDFLRLFQEGIENVAATSGTALTTEQGKLIKRYTNTVYMCYDSDDAGISSTVKSAKVLLPLGIDLKMIVLPKGEDPDSIVLSRGKETFIDYVGKAAEFSDYLLRYYRSHDEYGTPRGKTAAARHVLSLVARIPDSLKQDFYLQDLAVKMHIDLPVLKEELVRQAELYQQEINRSQEIAVKQLQREKAQKRVLDTKSGVTYGDYEAEKDAVYLALQLPGDEGKEFIYQFTLEHFQNSDTRKIVADIFSSLEDEGKIDILTVEEKHYEYFSKNQKKSIFIRDTMEKPDKLEILKKDVYGRLERKLLLKEQRKLIEKLKEVSPGTEGYQVLTVELMGITRKLNELK